MCDNQIITLICGKQLFAKRYLLKWLKKPPPKKKGWTNRCRTKNAKQNGLIQPFVAHSCSLPTFGADRLSNMWIPLWENTH